MKNKILADIDLFETTIRDEYLKDYGSNKNKQVLVCFNSKNRDSQ